ncbi:hypothetical protein [Leptospira andrefontaineae]|uniref:Uncharacterized protein n=1 Tax=Leptospira andrefontaineae TaxID=2484976 RepID=A0A4R9H7A7_9LEPT|nr:hypothetical protein [Leptospira andrefontaineae]TGK41519.1 hypothetical protein EHO65_08860 [Leptospira andrefontaineae]
MRLQAMSEIISQYAEKFSVVHSNSGGNHFFNGLLSSKLALENLQSIPPLSEDIINFLRKYSIATVQVDSMMVSPDTVSQLNRDFKALKDKIAVLDSLLQSLIVKDGATTAFIKLYELNSLEELENLISSLRKIIFLPLANLEGDLVLSGFDVGSKYFNILITAALTFTFFTNMIRESFDLYVHGYQKVKITEKLIETYAFSELVIKELQEKTREEYNKDLAKSSEKLYDNLSDAEKEKISNKNEFINNTKFALDELAKLMDKGLEIHHSIEASPEAKANFPDFSAAKQLIESQKLLDKRD